MSADGLLRGFRDGWGAEQPLEDDALERRVGDAWSAATAAWPGVEVDPAVFGRGLALRLDREAAISKTLPEFPCAELFLILGCADGQAAAIKGLEARFITPLRPVVAQLGAAEDVIDDILSQVRARLLVGTSQADPRILQFRGQSSLYAWLKVIVVREALATLRKPKYGSEEDHELEALLASDDDLEFAEARVRYREAFRVAFGQALRTLDPTQRTVLRHHLLDRLSIDEIGELKGVHRSTAARWLSKIRDELYRETRLRLLEQLELRSGDFDGVMQLVRSQLEFSVGRHLQSEPE